MAQDAAPQAAAGVAGVRRTLAATRCASGGVWRLATDWAEYADAMRAALDGEPCWPGGVTDSLGRSVRSPGSSAGAWRGRAVTDLTYRRV